MKSYVAPGAESYIRRKPLITGSHLQHIGVDVTGRDNHICFVCTRHVFNPQHETMYGNNW
ncbi:MULTISPECIES: hypothetical protein [Nitrosomonas]|uniref:hypothetical protein n=1 Tax=Nitrosomonas TaxID=914 RepID=UPI00115FE1D0|nr:MULTISPECIES: hypothetical protein [Nitrosomonas]